MLTAGNARLDALINRAAQGHSPLRVLVATQPFVQEFDYNAALVESLETAASDLNFPLVWILKPHPREPLGKYETVRDELASRSQSVTLFNGPFEDALSEADVVLSRTSTSLEFAALGGVPGIAHLHRYPRDIVDRLDYLRSSVNDKSYDTSGLRALLRAYAPEKRVETFRQIERAMEQSDNLLEILMYTDPGRYVEYESLLPHLADWSLWFGNGYGFRYDLDSDFLFEFGMADHLEVTNAHFTPLAITAKFGLFGLMIWIILIAQVLSTRINRKSFVEYACRLAFISMLAQSLFAYGFFINMFVPFYIAMSMVGSRRTNASKLPETLVTGQQRGYG